MNKTCILHKRRYPTPHPHIAVWEITYLSKGIQVKGLLAEPRMYTSAILYLRGGIQSVGMVRPSRITQLAEKGFLVFAPYYRGNRGGQGKDEFAGKDRYDASNGVEVLHEWAANLPVHVFAFSRGGIMALWTALLQPTIVSVTLWGAMTHIVQTYQDRLDMRRMMKRVIGGTPTSNPSAYEEREASLQIEKINCPFFLLHGQRDKHVSIQQSWRLEKLLLQAEKEVITHYESHYTHYVHPQENDELVRIVCQWMKVQEERGIHDTK